MSSYFFFVLTFPPSIETKRNRREKKKSAKDNGSLLDSLTAIPSYLSPLTREPLSRTLEKTRPFLIKKAGNGLKSFATDNATSLVVIDDGYLHLTSSDYFAGKYECNFYNPTTFGNKLKLYQIIFL